MRTPSLLSFKKEKSVVFRRMLLLLPRADHPSWWFSTTDSTSVVAVIFVAFGHAVIQDV